MRVIGTGGPAAGRPRRRLGALLVAVAVGAAAPTAAAATAAAGTPSVYVAAPATAAAGTPYVYVTNSGDGTVSAYDAATGTVTAAIHAGTQPWGVAVSPDCGTVYVANNLDSTVSVIDSATGTVTATIPVGAAPAGVAAASVPAAGKWGPGQHGDATAAG